MPAPKLDRRSIVEIEASARALAMHYVPDWSGVAQKGDPGRRALASFARLMELLIERENRIPEKSFVEFLDFVGIEASPGSPARVPVTFVLAKNAPEGAEIPARTQVATTQSESVDAQTFETIGAFFATPRRIVKAIALAPMVEGYAELELGPLPPTAAWLADESRRVIALAASSGELQPVPHVLYLASETLLGRDEVVDVTLTFTLASGNAAALSVDNLTWMGFDSKAKAWVELSAEDLEPSIPTEIGVRLRNVAGLGASEVHGAKGHFVAALLKAAPLVGSSLPQVSKISGSLQASVPSAAAALDFAFAEAKPIDFSKPVRPFGDRPRYGDAFYLGSLTAFSPEIASVALDFRILPYTNKQLEAMFKGIQAPFTPGIVSDVEWQYLNAAGVWTSIAKFRHTITAAPGNPLVLDRDADVLEAVAGVEELDGSGALFGDVNSNGSNKVQLELPIPTDIGLLEVHGQQAYWLRAILRSKDPYGSDGFVIPGVASNPPTPPVFVGPLYVPPTIESLSVSTTHRTDAIALERVIAENALDVVDATATLATSTAFRPFLFLTETAAGTFAPEPALYIGLDRALEHEFHSLYVQLDEASSQASAALESGKPRVAFEYLAASGTWNPLDVEDGTRDLTTSGTVAFLAPSDAALAVLFPLLLDEKQRAADPRLAWLRARLSSGTYDHPPRVLGLYLNTVMAENRSTLTEDLLAGSGNGKPGQEILLVKSPLLAGELWVREPEQPSENELERLRSDLLDALRLDNAGATLDAEALIDRRARPGAEPEIWVRWQRVANFAASGERSRHYTLDAVRGVLGLGGKGGRGLIPPVGKDNLALRGVQTGGGEAARRAATPLAVKELKTSLPFVSKVFNVAPATGGSNPWSIEDTQRFGPQRIKNRGRAITTEDYEWMVLERFGEVGKVRCLETRAPGAGHALAFQPGAVTVIVVPKSEGNLPQPSSGLSSEIRAHLQAKTLGCIVDAVHVIGPSYEPISIQARVEAASSREASLVARRVACTLEAWLHPLTGGDDKRGWTFGRPVHLSEVYAVIAGVAGVDHVRSASFLGAPGASSVLVEENSLTASGVHEIEVS